MSIRLDTVPALDRQRELVKPLMSRSVCTCMLTSNNTRNSAIADKPSDAFRDTVTFKLGLGVTEGHWKCHHLIQRMRLSIDVQ